jgi:sortase A
MLDKRDLEGISVEDLERLVAVRKRAQRRARIERMRAEGRLVRVDGLRPPDLEESTGPKRAAAAWSGQGLADMAEELDGEEGRPWSRIRWRWVANRFLLLVEIGAVVGLIILAVMVWLTNRELNQELAEVQDAQSAAVALPTPVPTPVISVAVLPSGHKPPIDGRPPEPGEAGDIPEHLLPIVNAYIPPPIPTPGPEQARRLQVAAIGIDKPIVQGDDWEQLKKGVGQHIGSALPGQKGNVVLSAHNDIYGMIFRHLDRLKPGDEIIISTERQSYTYVVSEIQVVAPTDVWVMAPTEHASTTLISCYPYMVNNKRIVVFADLAATGPLTRSTS